LPRRIVTKSLAVAMGGNEEPDDYKTRLLKYIPAETNTIYVAALGFVHTAQNELPAETVAEIPFPTIIIAIAVACFFFNLGYMRWIAKETNLIRLSISVGAFVVWAIAFGEIFASFTWWYPFMGSLLVLFYTGFAGLYLGK
jgi:hypothetical protein